MPTARMERLFGPDLLGRVERPARYLGGEVNSVRKDLREVDVRICLAFPDLYDLGLANVGLLILYSQLNRQEGVWCERTYAPALDMEARMREGSVPLWSWESRTPLGEFDAVGFTLQYELCYTNLLNMLDLAGIPLRSAGRDDRHPLILAGGPCVFNPEPLADFIDGFVIGDGEEAVVEIVAALRRTKDRPRGERLDALAAIDGVYVPARYETASLTDGTVVVLSRALLDPNTAAARWLGFDPAARDLPAAVRKRLVLDLDRTPYATDYVVPWVEQVHDRVSLEIFRGCMRGCRFCQAGMITRPVRERSLDTIAGIVEETRRSTGYDELTLMSLSSCDYSRSFELVRNTVGQLAPHHVAVSMPSTRVDGFNMEVAETIAGYRKSNWTFAPEAGTQRLRDAIAKPITQEELFAKTEQVFAGGWSHVKLYFMIGLPTETDEDLTGIAELANEVVRRGRRHNPKARVNLGVSTHVPKGHTPFQWAEQISIEETLRRQRLVRSRLRSKSAVKFGHHDAETSFLEGVFSRGDRRLGRVLEEALRLGCRFDGWTEHFRYDSWREAFDRAGVDPEPYLKAIPTDRPLPWDHVDSLVEKKFHEKEWEKTLASVAVEDCRLDAHCYLCGPISRYPKGKENPCVRMIRSTREGLKQDRIVLQSYRARREIEGRKSPRPELRPGGGAVQRVRFRFTKLGELRFLSHLELLRAMHRALRRAGIPMAFSQGFHPHPKLSFAAALPVGVESEAEWADLELVRRVGPDHLRERFNRAAPEGIRIEEARDVPLDHPGLTARLDASTYRIGDGLPAAAGGPVDLDARAAELLAGSELWVVRASRKGTKRVNLRSLIRALRIEAGGEPGAGPARAIVTLDDNPKAKGRPQEVARLLWGHAGPFRIRKIRSEFLSVD